MRKQKPVAGDALREGYVVNPLNHLGLAYKEARKFHSSQLSREDLEQNALVGLCHAARTYDPARGVTFGHHALFQIRAELLRSVASGFRRGRFGNEKLNERVVFRLTRLARRGELNLQTARAELERGGLEVVLSDYEVELAVLYVSMTEMPLDAPVTGDENHSVGEGLVDPTQPESLALRHLSGEEWLAFLQGGREELNALEKRVFDRCLTADDPDTLSRLAREGGVSRQYIHQTLLRVREKLRARARALHLREEPE